MDKLNSLNLPELQKKLKNNPQLAIGASAVVGFFGFVYLIKKLATSNDNESHIPDFALPNDDREMTERLTNIRNRRQARKKQKQKQSSSQTRTPRNKQNNRRKKDENNEIDSNNNDSNNNINLNDESINSNENTNDNNNNNGNLNTNGSQFDPNNTQNEYSNDNETNNSNSNNNVREDGFTADKYYNPHLRIRKENLQRKPDAAFMALFGLYASNTDENSYSGSNNTLNQNLGYMAQSNYNEPPFPQNFQASNGAPSTMSFESKEAQDDQYSSDNASTYQNGVTMNNNSINENGITINTMNAQNVATHDNSNNGNGFRFEVSTSPITTPTNHNIPSVNALDRLKDLYARNKLPPSLQPDSLSLSFQSNPKQAAIVNRSNNSLLSTIKQII